MGLIAQAPAREVSKLDSLRANKDVRRRSMTVCPSPESSRSINRVRCFAILCSITLGLDALGAEPQSSRPVGPEKAEATSQRIAFVHLRFTGAEVQLLDFKVVPGRFKTAPEPVGERILVQVFGAAGKPLWEGWLNDPRSRVLETDDSAQPRRRKAVAVTFPNPEVVVRVPFIEEGQTLHIWRATPANASSVQYHRLSTVQLREH
jgi:hypothetical protein